MRIGIILEQLRSIGGTSIHVSSMAKCLAEEGHEVHVISLGEVNKSLDLGIAVHHSAGTLPENILNGNSTAQQLIDTLLEITNAYNLDIIHAHYPCAMLACAVNKVINNVPYVITLHGYEIQSFLLRDFQLYATLVGITLPSAIISVSKALANEFTEVVGNNVHVPLEIIPDGTNVEVSFNKTQHIRNSLNLNSKFTFIFVGRLSVEKGLRELLQAFKDMVIRYPECNLIIVGKGQMFDEVNGFIQKNSLSDNVFLIGEVPHSEVINYLSASDILVLPSHSEGLGTVILEAFAAGIPVIGTTVGGIPEAIIHNDNGVLVPPSNPEKLMDEMITVVKNREHYKHLKNGAALSATQYSWKFLNEKIIDIYKQSCERTDLNKKEILDIVHNKYDFSQGNPWDLKTTVPEGGK